MFKFMITLDTSFPMGKAHGWARDIPKTKKKLAWMGKRKF
jgi:hypothetical protein